MGKYIYALMMVVVIELALWLFGGADYAQTSLFTLITNPSTIFQSGFYDLFTTGLLAFGAVAIVTGFIFQGNLYGIYAVIAGSILTFSRVIVGLFTFINGQLADKIGISSVFSTTISVIIVTPLLLYFIVSTIEWVRGN